ncbi:cysteine desulfurase family protein [Caryophanon latum]|uniref:Aminotransferase class V n=1 Tax=Caryophanon latum TaxID=33977 RepID=A0A1C0YRF5_9BACL|nr:cysteine desulfurase family protein [Caryophanon latum]OCS89699.1 aminotransferase class V [Caryophanon latum]
MIYLDNSATTKVHDDVLASFIQVNNQYYGNAASIHAMGVESNDLLTRARMQVAQLVYAEPENVIFTSGGTESNNFAFYGVAAASKHKGRHIITTAVEHPCVLEAAKRLQQQGYEVDYLSVNAQGVISLEELRDKIRKDTVLVSIMHVNNEMGAIMPIQQAAAIIHDNSRAVFHVDAIQSFGKLPITLADGPDIITISGHKIHALKGSGVLAMKKHVQIEPFIVGGGQEFGMRSGTVAVPQAVAFAKAARMAVEQMPAHAKTYSAWKQQLFQYFESLGDAVNVISPADGAPHIVSVGVQGLKGEILINALQKEGIIVSTSSACSSRQTKTSHVMEAIKVPQQYKDGVIRISFGANNTEADIQKFKQVFTHVMHQLKGEFVR